jgi:predicted Rossmann fold nucleotide-binding protein DprA/Smf involved in DNA uptake
MEFGRRVFGVPRNATQEVSFVPNQWIKQGGKPATKAEDVIEELPIRCAALVQAKRVESAQVNPLAEQDLNPTAKKIYALLSAEQTRHIDDLGNRVA